MVNKDDVVTAYQDLTGRFPVNYPRVSEYILVRYHYNASCILGYPIQDHQAPTITKAWQHLQNEFKQAGIAPESWVLDNKISGNLKVPG